MPKVFLRPTNRINLSNFNCKLSQRPGGDIAVVCSYGSEARECRSLIPKPLFCDDTNWIWGKDQSFETNRIMVHVINVEKRREKITK